MSLVLVPLVRAVARSIGAVVQPAVDGPGRRPAGLFGGVAIALTVLGGLALFNGAASQVGILACGLVVFLIGLADDIVGLKPTTSVAAQIVLASAFLFLQYRLEWTRSVTLDSLLTLFWVVGVTNVVNRLDRMDGLCAGVASVISAGIIIRLYWPAHGVEAVDVLAVRHAAVLLGALAGFLVYNTHPASILMGGSGGLFIGLNLTALVLSPGASPLGLPSPSGGRLILLPIVLVPVLAVFLVRVLDSGLFTLWSARSGPPTSKGSDRTRYRLFGSRPSRGLAVAVLWLLGAATTTIVVVTQITTEGSGAGAMAAVVVMVMTIAVVVSGVGVHDESDLSRSQQRIMPWPVEPFHRWRAVEVAADACLVLVAYYGAYRLRYPDPQLMSMFSFFRTSLPFVLAAQLAALFAVGTYAGRWPLFGLRSIWTLAKGVILGVVVAQLLLLYVYRFEIYPRSPFLVYAALVVLLLAGIRGSFRLVAWYLDDKQRVGVRRGQSVPESSAKDDTRYVVRMITRLNIGGPSIQATSLSRRLGPFGYSTLLLYGRLSPGEGDMSYLLTPDVSAEMVPALGRALEPLQDARAFWRTFRTICRVRPAVVHTHTAKAGAIGRLAAIAYNETLGRLNPARIVHTYHGHVFDGYFGSASTSVFIVIERWLARHSDALVGISPRISADLVDTYRIARPGQVRVIPLGFDLTEFSAIDDHARERARLVLDVPDGRSIVTTVGRLTEIKQHDLFLRMAALVAEVRPDVDFLIAGDGELREDLEAQARMLGIAARVRFLGWRTDLVTVYAATDVFVLTSRNEGTPVALIEAMASGVPGVSTDVGGVRDVIRSVESGAVVPFGSPEDLAEQVLRLTASPGRRRAMGSRARQDVLSRFAIERLLRDMAALYDELLTASPRWNTRAKDASTVSKLDAGERDRAQTTRSLWFSFIGVNLRLWVRQSVSTMKRELPEASRSAIKRLREPAGLALVTTACAAWLAALAFGPSAVRDPNLRRAVDANLAADAVTSGLQLEVAVNRGVVSLAGETTTRAEQGGAVARARSVSGVRRVVNQMRLSDATIARSVAAALAADPVIGRLAIEVTSRRGVVSLSSDSTNAEERKRAVAVAERVDGVRAVDDQMR